MLQVAYDAAGAPTNALLGFCKKNGVKGGSSVKPVSDVCPCYLVEIHVTG